MKRRGFAPLIEAESEGQGPPTGGTQFRRKAKSVKQKGEARSHATKQAKRSDWRGFCSADPEQKAGGAIHKLRQPTL